jgi:hypothetical protein
MNTHRRIKKKTKEKRKKKKEKTNKDIFLFLGTLPEYITYHLSWCISDRGILFIGNLPSYDLLTPFSRNFDTLLILEGYHSLPSVTLCAIFHPRDNAFAIIRDRVSVVGFPFPHLLVGIGSYNRPFEESMR